MFLLSLISSIASIVSLLISFFDYFKKWKTYLLYMTCATAGIAIGTILSFSQQTIQHFSQSQLIYLIALVGIVSLLILFVYKYLTSSSEPLFIVIIVLVAMGYFSIRLLNSVESSQSFIKPNDYLTLSNYYYDLGDFTRAADFLKKYREIQTINLSEKMLDSIDNKIEILYYKGFDKLK